MARGEYNRTTAAMAELAANVAKSKKVAEAGQRKTKIFENIQQVGALATSANTAALAASAAASAAQTEADEATLAAADAAAAGAEALAAGLAAQEAADDAALAAQNAAIAGQDALEAAQAASTAAAGAETSAQDAHARLDAAMLVTDDEVAPVTPTGLTVTVFQRDLGITWDAPPNNEYVASHNVRITPSGGSAVIRNTVDNHYRAMGLTAGVQYTVEVQHVDRWNRVSPWASTTATPQPTIAEQIAAGTSLPAGQITGSLPSSQVSGTFPTGAITGNWDLTRVINSLPQANLSQITDPQKLADSVVIDTKLAAWNIAATQAIIAQASIGTAYIADAAITTAKIGGAQITNALIANLAVSSGQIQDAAITNAKILDATILNAKIADAQITGAKIASATILTANIGDAQITTAKIAGLAVETANIKDAAIVTAKIGDLQVTTAKIANLAVTEAQIANLAVTNAKIGNLAVAEANIAALAVTEAKIGALAVTNAKIGDLAVNNAKIADATIASAKIASLAVDKLITGTLTAATITLSSTGLIRAGSSMQLDSGGLTMLQVGNYNTTAASGTFKMSGRLNSFTGTEFGAMMFYANSAPATDGYYRGAIIRADGAGTGSTALKGAIVLHATQAGTINQWGARIELVASQSTAAGAWGDCNIFADIQAQRDIYSVGNMTATGSMYATSFMPQSSLGSTALAHNASFTVTHNLNSVSPANIEAYLFNAVGATNVDGVHPLPSSTDVAYVWDVLANSFKIYQGTGESKNFVAEIMR